MLEPTKHYPDRVYSKAELRKMNREQRQELICRLSLMPSLTSRDIAEMLNLAVEYVDNELGIGAKKGFPSRRLWGLSTRDLQKKKEDANPDASEWHWRLTHQSEAYLKARFGPALPAMVRQAGMMSFAPEWLVLSEDVPKRQTVDPADLKIVDLAGQQLDVRQMVVPTDPSRRHQNVTIIGTDVEIQCHDKREQAIVNGIVNLIAAKYQMSTSGSWRSAQPLVEQFRDYYRYLDTCSDQTREQDASVLQNCQAIYKEILNSIDKLPIEKRRAPGDYELFERARQRAVQYWAEHAYKHAVACRVCGQIEYVYLPFYQSLTSANKAFDEIASSALDDAEKWRRIHTIWSEVRRNPHFHIQLRDLGVAWSQHLVEWGQSLMLPQVGQFRRVRHTDTAANLFEPRPAGSACEVLRCDEQTVAVRWVSDQTESVYGRDDFVSATDGPITWEQIADGLAAQVGVGPDCFNEIIPASPLARGQRVGLGEYEVAHVE